MGKETLIPGAEIVDAVFAPSRQKKPVLRAPAVAQVKDLTVAAMTGQFVQLSLTEGSL
jgi:hypothetical protein